MTLSLQEYRGLPADWEDLVAGCPVSATRRWINLNLGRLGDGYRTFALHDGSRPVVAVGGTILDQPLASPRVDPYHILSGRSAELGLIPDGPHPWRGLRADEVLPTALFMYPNYEMFPVGQGAESPEVLRLFLHELRGWGRRNHLASISFLYLPSWCRPFIDVLKGEGIQIVPLTNLCILPITWQDFPGYLQALPRKRRFVVRAEMRRITEENVILAEESLGGVLADGLLELRGNVIAKYGGHPSVKADLGMLDRIRTLFTADEIFVSTARHDGKLLGFMLFLQDGDHWTAFFNGMDYDDPHSRYIYFATAFYHPVGVAPQRGIRNISYGLGSWEAKRLRGCNLVPLAAAELRLSADLVRKRG
jgi:hypothetical protein